MQTHPLPYRALVSKLEPAIRGYTIGQLDTVGRERSLTKYLQIKTDNKLQSFKETFFNKGEICKNDPIERFRRKEYKSVSGFWAGETTQ